MSLKGLRVLSLESRKAAAMEELLRKQGGNPFVAPSMRELPLAENTAVFDFAERLFAGQIEMIVLLTGVGTRQIYRTLAARYPESAFPDALRRTVVVARGPKPAAAVREWQVSPQLIAPEPNTWREVLSVTEGRSEKRIAIQEYGRSNPELIAGFRARGADTTSVRVYQWDLPEDATLLREAAHRLAAGEFDVVLFTTAMQIAHLMRVAEELGISDAVMAGVRKASVGSIGPTTTETLEEFGILPDFEPPHPKMGFLVLEAAQRAPG